MAKLNLSLFKQPKRFENTLWYGVIRSMRPRQWIKNTAVYAALLFSGLLFFRPEEGPYYFFTVTQAFFLFSLTASSIYLINDVVDLEADKRHPFKRKRPIASGQVPVSIALFVAITLILSVFLASFWLPVFFRLLILAYIILQVTYSTKLKHVPILDVASIATGFLIRVYAGAVVVNLHMSVWFLLTVISASLFLAVGKRQSERTLLNKESLGDTRKTLKRYSQRLLDQYTGMFANATWLSYALYTFQNEYVRPDERLGGIYAALPKTLHSQKLLMLTIPFVIYGVMRYLQLVYEDNKGESPELVLLRDKPLLSTVFAFGLSVMIVIYGLS